MQVKRFLLLFMAICLASGVKAQIYNSDVLFYVSESANLKNPQSRVEIRKFENGKLYSLSTSNDEANLRTVCNNLSTNSNYYENLAHKWERRGLPYWSDYHYSYNSELTNQKWNVYSKIVEANMPLWPAHTNFEAFYKDYSKFLTWYEPDYDNMGQRVYKRIMKSELRNITFTGARDFLQ